MELKNNKYRKILFVVNPNAGDAGSYDLMGDIKHHFVDEQMVTRTMIMNKKDNDIWLKKHINEFSPETVVACGGDGTVNFVADHILNRNIKLGIVPMGSYNGMAYQMGIPSDIREALKIIKHGQTRPVDAIRINSEYICLHLSDLGTNARVIKRYKADRFKGFKGYIIQYFKELSKTKKFRCDIKTEQNSIKAKVAMVIIANAAYYGTGVTVNPEAELDDGLFEIILIKSYPFWFLFYVLIALLRGSSGKEKWTNIIKCKHAEITVKPAQELQVDGELAGSSVNISPEILSQQLEILSIT